MADTASVSIVEVTPTNLYEAQHSSLYLKVNATIPTTNTVYTFDATDSTKFKIGSQDAYLDTRFSFDGTLHSNDLSGSLSLANSGALGSGTLYTANLTQVGYILTTSGVN